MPGVPRSRGCDGCRAQKKRCDQAKPSCSRCTRLQLACTGSGQQRYIFKEQSGTELSLAVERGKKSPTKSPPLQLSTASSLLQTAFLAIINPSSDLRFNLHWAYGDFLLDIPARIGENEALDTAVEALIDAHSVICSHRAVTSGALTKYGKALNRLRSYLDDPSRAHAPETLAAVMLLLICQSYLGLTNGRFSGHCEGAAQIIKARGNYNPEDAFESKLLLSIRGPVVFEALLNKNILLTPKEWKTLVENHLDDNSFGGSVMKALSRIPSLLQSKKSTHKADETIVRMLGEIRACYQVLKAGLDALREQLALFRSKMAEPNPVPAVTLGFANIQRIYGIGLTAAIVMNFVLGADDADDLELPLDLMWFSTEVMTIAREATRYRPIGASYVALCLYAAWMGTENSPLRAEIEEALLDYHSDYSWSVPDYLDTRELELLLDQLRSPALESTHSQPNP